MNLHTDLPTRTQIDRLIESRHAASVSIYLSTSPTSNGDAERIELKNLATEAKRQLELAGADRTDLVALDEAINELSDDDAFWHHQARSLAIFVTPDALTTFRLPNHLVDLVEVSDRFHVKPLLRAVTFPNVGVRARARPGIGSAHRGRPGDRPRRGERPRSSDRHRGCRRQVFHQGSWPQREAPRLTRGRRCRCASTRARSTRRSALCSTRTDLPLILAAAEPLDSIYRSVNTYPHLAPTTIGGNPETTSDADLVASARVVLDEVYAAELKAIHDLYGQRGSESRASGDIVDVARAATFGAVDTVLVDIDEVVPGVIDEEIGRRHVHGRAPTRSATASSTRLHAGSG